VREWKSEGGVKVGVEIEWKSELDAYSGLRVSYGNYLYYNGSATLGNVNKVYIGVFTVTVIG
jgi:hypothetical protein